MAKYKHFSSLSFRWYLSWTLSAAIQNVGFWAFSDQHPMKYVAYFFSSLAKNSYTEWLENQDVFQMECFSFNHIISF